MARGLDWEKAAKREYVREHGSLPSWSDLPRPKSLERRPEDTKTGKALAKRARERCRPALDEFRRLAPEDRIARADWYRDRIRQLCALEQRAVPASKRRYADAIKSAESQLLGEIKTLVRKAKKGPASSAGSPRTGSKEKTRRSGAEPQAASPPPSRVRALDSIELTAHARGGIVTVKWKDHPEADRWLLVIVRKKGRGQKAVRSIHVPRESLLAEVRGLDLAAGPYGVRLYALRSRVRIGRGAVDGLAGMPGDVGSPTKAASSQARAGRKTNARSRGAGSKKSRSAKKAKRVLAASKICVDGPDWKPKRRCPCSRCRTANRRPRPRGNIKAAMSGPGPRGRPRVSFWRGR